MRLVEAARVDPVAEPEEPHRAVLSENPVIMLQLELVTEELVEPEICLELVRIPRRGDVTDAYRPLVPVSLDGGAPRIATCVGWEIPGRVGHECHVEKGLSRIPRDRAVIEDVEDREAAERDHEAPGGDRRAEHHRVRRLLDRRPSEVDGLPEKRPRPVELRRLRAALLQLEVLDRAAETVEVRQRSLGDHLGNEVEFRAVPEPQPEEERERPGEAPLGAGNEGIVAPVRVRVRRMKRKLPARDVRVLPVEIPPLVLDVVQPAVGQQVHEVVRVVVVRRGWRRLGTCRAGHEEQRERDHGRRDAARELSEHRRLRSASSCTSPRRTSGPRSRPGRPAG